jgi:hypothetical protein
VEIDAWEITKTTAVNKDTMAQILNRIKNFYVNRSSAISAESPVTPVKFYWGSNMGRPS